MDVWKALSLEEELEQIESDLDMSHFWDVDDENTKIIKRLENRANWIRRKLERDSGRD